MLIDLRQDGEAISMEAATAIDTAAERMPAFLARASECLSKNIFAPIANLFSGKDLGYLAYTAPRTPYSETRGLRAVAPDGFKGALVDYGNDLLDTVEKIADFEKDVLIPFGSWLGQRIADPKSLASIQKGLRIPGLHEPKIDQLKKRLDGYFPTKTDDKEPIYGDLFKRQQDWSELNSITKKLQTIYQDGRYEKVQKKVAEIIDLLDLLAARMGEFKEEYVFSSVVMAELSTITVQVAEHVEYYGVVRHRVDEFLRVVNENVVVLREHF